MNSYKYHIEIIPDEKDGGYVFSIPELPGCVTTANSLEEGFVLMGDALKGWVSSCLEDGIEIPKPKLEVKYES